MTSRSHYRRGDLRCLCIMVNITQIITAQNKTSPLAERPKGDSEVAVTERFAQYLLNSPLSFPRGERILLREFDGIQGRPDIVDAEIKALPADLNLDVLAALLRSPTKARLLSSLRYGTPRTSAYLGRITGLPAHSVRGHVREMEAAGLVKTDTHNSVYLLCHLPWDMVDIAAYEVKLSNWKRALFQGVGYRAFSKSVWVVMPPNKGKGLQKAATAFQAYGIGLMSYSENGEAKVIVRAKRHRRPTSRRLYLMAAGTALAKFLEHRRRSHRRLRPESVKRA